MQQKVLTEEEAYMALLQGNEKGLDFFFNHYYTPLVCYAASITKDEETAKEIASEAFVKLWRIKESITVCKKVRPWLYRIVCNAAINHIKSPQRTYHRIDDSDYPNPDKIILDKLIETETYNRLYLLLQNLSPRSRQIFQMFYFQNKSIKEIARALGISVNTVKTQKVRAIQTLKTNKGFLYLFIIFSLFFI